MSRGTGELTIGIDLGTTNTALAWRGPEEEGSSTPFPVPQLVRPGEVRPRSLLPSFLYLPHESELPPGATRASLARAAGPRSVVGELARSLGAATPIRLVSSAKSWLCHAGVDRRAPILPAGAPPRCPGSRRSTPRRATSRTSAAWDHERAAEDAERAGRAQASSSPCRPRSTPSRAS